MYQTYFDASISEGITLNTYGHLCPNEQKKLAEMLNGQKEKKDKGDKEE